MEAKKRSMPTPEVRCVSGRQFMMIGRLHAAGTVLNLGTTTSQKCEAVPRRARI